MQENTISSRQTLAVLIMFIIGSTIIVSPGKEANRDAWLAVLLALIVSIPLALLYGRLLKLHHGNFYEMLETFLGPVLGKVFTALFSWYGFHIGANILREYTQFIQIASFPMVGQFVFSLPIITLCIWCIRSGIRTLGRFALLAVPALVGLLVINTLFSINIWNVANLEPVLYDGMGPVLKGASQFYALPFLEVIMVVIFCQPMTDEKRATSVFVRGFIIGSVVVVLIYARNIMVLGDTLVSKYYFPSYEVVKLVNIGRFIQGLQALAALVLMLGYYVKITIFLYAAVLGVSRLLKIDDYRRLAAPIGLLVMVLSFTLTKDMSGLLSWVSSTFLPYSLPFGLALPVVVWLVGERKKRREKPTGQDAPQPVSQDQGNGDE